MRAAALAAVLLFLVVPAAAAEPAPVSVGTFDQPVHVSGPPGDPSRLFVVEKPGRVQVVVAGQKKLFLDLDASVDDQGERGLLSIAFAPDYAASGLFYVFYTATDGDLVVLEGRRAADDPDRADPAHRRILFTVEHSSATNHNGGQLAFGPDGALYVSTGDGATDRNQAQDPASRLGKILRVDPRVSPEPSVWARGLRNPWRFSFDPVSGDIYIGDVGEGQREEVDRSPFSAVQANYGWPACEGDIPAPCTIAGAVAPVLALPSSQGYRSVVGGVVVRDPGLPSLAGRYLFGDHYQPTLRSAAPDGSGLRDEPGLPVRSATAVSEDGCGHVHVASLSGAVYRIQDGAPGACVPPPGTPPPGTPPPVTPPVVTRPVVEDTRPCAVSVLRPKRTQRILRRGRSLRLALRSDEACTATLRAERFRTRRGIVLRPGVARVVRLRATRKGLRRMRRAVARSERPRLRVTVRISARDAAGNAAVLRIRPGVR